MRRIASGVALHDARMLVDPLRSQSRAVGLGALVVVAGLAGCFVISLIRPAGVAGNDAVLADRATAALYVRVGDTLHPVLNLTSARLIAGKPVNPTMVKSTELDRFPRGNLIGIPGAPERMVQSITHDAAWTVCESSDTHAVTVIAGKLDTSGDRAAELPRDHAAVVSTDGGTWLLWDGKRSALNLADTAVTAGLGLGTPPVVRPITSKLFNTIPESPALTAPAIPAAGSPVAYPLPVPAPVGAVLVSYSASNNPVHYVVLSDGVQQISPVMAAVLRNTNSYGLEQPPRLTADQVAHLPTANALDNGIFPANPVTLLNSAQDPALCSRYTKAEQATAGSVTLLAGSALPLATSVRTVQLVEGSDSPVRVAVAPGTGYLVQPVGGGGFQWLSDTGVRYGIDTEGDGDKTLGALGLTPPALPIPAAMLDLFATGPTLSRSDALTARDSLSPDARQSARAQNTMENR